MAMIIIEGMNRTEFCKPKSKDVDRRRFYETRGMLYRAYPDQFTRMRMKEFGIETGTEEVIVYQENCIHPQWERGTKISFDKLMADIDENKMIVGEGNHKRAWAHMTSRQKNKLLQYAPLILVGLVLLYTFAANGGL